MIHIVLKFNATVYDLSIGHRLPHVPFLYTVNFPAPSPSLLGIGLHQL